MIAIIDYIKNFDLLFESEKNLQPWEITKDLPAIIRKMIEQLNTDNFIIKDGIAIHKTATVEERTILKAPIIISEKCFIGANAYLRNGVYLGKGSSVGPACEVKTSIIFDETEIAHLNFIGDSIIGSHTNFEAGSVAANYFNERRDKTISVLHNNEIVQTTAEKFGSLVGDNCKIGANAVLSPGTVLKPGTIIKRLELVEQVKVRTE
jgi:NDP-sugar pyrophosphorylase family protein